MTENKRTGEREGLKEEEGHGKLTSFRLVVQLTTINKLLIKYEERQGCDFMFACKKIHNGCFVNFTDLS